MQAVRPDHWAAHSDAPQELASETTTLVAGDFTFQLRTAGPSDGEPVMLLYGFPETSLEWEAQIAVLADAGYLPDTSSIRCPRVSRMNSPPTNTVTRHTAIG